MLKYYRNILLELNFTLSFYFPGFTLVPFQVISGVLPLTSVTQDSLLQGKFIFKTKPKELQ